MRAHISLIDDKADDAAINAGLRAGIEMRGSNLWVLMFAIFIASIGLNVNSTAAIIGAMLISPLMGPIMGIGYAVGVLDLVLVRHALKNLGIAVGIALATSTIYFAISPLTVADSELLARTTPTLWDVLIALFGGFAGIIGVTRKEKSTVIPGVAIATALMPPLCTAGFGLAHGNWAFVGGAFFLFTINCVFIAFSSAVVIRAFHVRQVDYVETTAAKKIRMILLAAVIATIIPSAYFAYKLVNEEVFKARAKEFVSREFNLEQTHVTELSVAPATQTIEVTLIGEYVASDKLAGIVARLPAGGLEGAKLRLHQSKDSRVDVSLLKTNVLKDLYTQSQQRLEEKDKIIARLQADHEANTRNLAKFKTVAAELHALFPAITDVVISTAIDVGKDSGVAGETTVVVNASAGKPVAAGEHAKIEDWLRIRTQAAHVALFIQKPDGPRRAKTR